MNCLWCRTLNINLNFIQLIHKFLGLFSNITDNNESSFQVVAGKLFLTLPTTLSILELSYYIANAWSNLFAYPDLTKNLSPNYEVCNGIKKKSFISIKQQQIWKFKRGNWLIYKLAKQCRIWSKYFVEIILPRHVSRIRYSAVDPKIKSAQS